MIDLRAIRFRYDENLEATLISDYSLEPVLEHFDKEGGLDQFRGQILTNSIKISQMLSPRLFGLFTETVSASSISGPMDLFVTPSAEANAFAVHASSLEDPGLVVLTSKLVELMSDSELTYVVGHELAHLSYQHYRMKQVQYAVPSDNDGNPQIPALLRCKLQTLDRLAEISADRAGYLLSGRDMNVAVSVFFKLASGLDEHHLKYDIGAFISQLDEILGLSKKDFLSQMSHPAIPIRVRSLQMLDEQLDPQGSIRDKDTLDAQVYDLTHLMEFEVTDEDAVSARDFLLAGSILATHVDGIEPTHELYDHLVGLITPFSSDPETLFASIESLAQAEELFARACTWLKANAGEEKFMLFRWLIGVVGFDGKLTKAEEDFMNFAADSIGITRMACANLLHEVRTTMLQAQHATGPVPRLK